MAMRSKVSQWHEMFCHDPQVMDLNLVRSKPNLNSDLNKKKVCHMGDYPLHTLQFASSKVI